MHLLRGTSWGIEFDDQKFNLSIKPWKEFLKMANCEHSFLYGEHLFKKKLAIAIYYKIIN